MALDLVQNHRTELQFQCMETAMTKLNASILFLDKRTHD